MRCNRSAAEGIPRSARGPTWDRRIGGVFSAARLYSGIVATVHFDSGVRMLRSCTGVGVSSGPTRLRGHDFSGWPDAFLALEGMARV